MRRDEESPSESSGRASGASSWRWQYPFASHFFDVGGQRLHYLDEGQGTPVVMVHGNPTWSFYFRNLVARFRHTNRMIAPDHVGCGLSDKPRRYQYCLAQHSDNLIRLIESLDLRGITLVVHDWGGAIGLRAACAQPDRFARLVLLNTGAFPPSFVPWRIAVCRIPGWGAMAVQGLNLFALAATRMALHQPSRMSRASKAGMLAPYDSWDHRRAIYRFVRDIPTSPRHATWHELAQLERSLGRLSHLPVCMIWGMRDWCFHPSCLAQLRQHFPHAEVHELEDVGHWVLEEATERVESILAEFLSKSNHSAAGPRVTGASQPR